MATQSITLAQSQLEGASLLLIYDDVTLVASGIEASVSGTAVGPMTIRITMKSGFSGTFTIQPSQFNQIINIPNNRQPTGTRTTTKFGVPTIDWGITSCGISFD